MSLSTGSRRVDSESVAPATAASGALDPLACEFAASGARLLGEVEMDQAKAVVTMKAWQDVTKQHSNTATGGRSSSRNRRRLAAPLLDFVSALRGAISAFGQGQVGATREFTLRQVAEITSMLECPIERSDVEATKILYLGELSPESGVVDLLSCIIAWAQRHPERSVDVCWAGSGDLKGVLRAQLKPANLTQTFMPPADADAIAALARARGILAVPNSGPVELLPIAQAMAAGLPVLGSARCAEVRMLVTSTVTGWLFDPLMPAEMSGALDAALSSSPARLAEMRAAVRCRLGALCHQGLDVDEDVSPQRTAVLFATSEQA